MDGLECHLIPGFWKKTEDKKTRRRQVLEEETNRDGHWVRDFSVRQESWPIIEHWAHEHGYRLCALKGRRRLYQKGWNADAYMTWVDVRHDPNRIVLTSWITVGFKLRAFTLFVLPPELPIEPTGFKGIRTRRDACRDLNSLLMRLRQPEILNSDGFHITDIDLSTLTLGAFLLLPLHYFLIAASLKMEVRTGLSNALLQTIAPKLQTLLVIGVGFTLVHHFGIIRKFGQLWVKGISVAVFSFLFAIVSVVLMTKTSSEVLEQKISYHCVLHFDEKKCAERLSILNLVQREALTKRIESLQKQLAQKTEAYGPKPR